MNLTSTDFSGATRHAVIFVDDDPDLLSAQSQGLEIAGFEVQPFARAAEALRQIDAGFDGVLVTDVRMSGMDGLTLFERVRAIDPEIPVILITGHGDVPMAVQALKDGAYDFLAKPFRMDDLAASIRRAAQSRRLVLENRQLRQLHAGNISGAATLLGESPVMQRLRQNIAQVADAEVDVLISGASGVGKESAARALHQTSRRRNRQFVQINCASLPEESFQAELFGVEAGAKFGPYGGGARRTIGRLERADRGTLLLAEVEGLSLAQQAKLLDVVEARQLWPVGSTEPRALDLRIVATTRSDLRASVESGAFRADLFYRLSGVTLHLPPLVERGGDTRLLFQHFLVRACARLNRPVPSVTAPIHAFLQNYAWPGNVRELEHFAERFSLGIEDALPMANTGNEERLDLAERVSQFEAEIIRETLSASNGDVQSTLQHLGLARKTFYDKVNRHGIRISDYRQR